jgi:hypothetical protein
MLKKQKVLAAVLFTNFFLISFLIFRMSTKLEASGQFPLAEWRQGSLSQAWL